MSMEHVVDTESKIIKYTQDLINKIFESETKSTVVGNVGDYVVYQVPGSDEYVALDITDNVLPESRYTRVTSTPAFMNVDELRLYLCDLMIDKFVLMKRDLERKVGKHEYGKLYL